jgi:ketosteroid isomerase-like protein
MTSERIELLRRGYEEANRGDYDAMLERWHPEIVIHDPSRPDASSPDGNWHRHDGARRYFRDWNDSFSETRGELEEFFEQGDWVITRVRVRSRGRGSGIEVENVRHHAAEIRDGKVIRYEVHEDRDAALRAADIEYEAP